MTSVRFPPSNSYTAQAVLFYAIPCFMGGCCAHILSTDRNEVWMRAQYIIMQQQQQVENQFISSLLIRFQQDESEATRETLERLCAGDDHRPEYLRAFNLLLNSRSSHARQRRDVAAIARLIADSPIFAVLEPCVTLEAEQGKSTDPQSLTMELTKLIANICNQNPHFVDNILAARPTILASLCALYSKPDTTPVDTDCISAVLNFLHNIALKETPLRMERVTPCLQAFLENLLTHSKFCTFISQKRFQSFVSSLFKFHANVPLVAFGVYTALIKAARALNEEYKRLAEAYKGLSQRISSPLQRASILERAGFADKKLIAIMKLFQKARSNIFGKFDALSFTSLLKIFVKIAIMRPVALLNQPIENKLLITIINDLMIAIQDYKDQIEANKILPQINQQQQQPSNQQQQQVIASPELQDGEEGEVLPPVEEERMNFTPAQLERFRNELKSFDSICEVTRHFSDIYFKIIKSTIETLAVGFDWVINYRNNHEEKVEETVQSYRFLIGILTVRLERILCMMLKLFPTEELTRGNYYREIVALLLKLLPAYFQSAIDAESKAILEELPSMEDAASESQGSAMRYIMESIDEESVKTFIQGKLLEKINIFSTIYEVILKFVYHLVDQQHILSENMTNFVHVFVAELREKHLNAITASPRLTLKQIEALRLALRVATELFHNNVNPSPEDEIRNKAKLYRYCRLLEMNGWQNGLFCLLGDILNNLQKHAIEKTSQLSDTLQHREEVTKTIFAKIIIQRAKTYVNFLTIAHMSRGDPELDNVDAERQYCVGNFEGYFAYLRAMNALIKQTSGGDRFVLFKEDILGTVLSRTLDYSLFFRDSNSEQAQRVEFHMLKVLKQKVDTATEELGEWMLNYSHLKLHRVPLMTRKVLHFDKVGLSIKIGETALLHQEQLAHVQRFIKQLSRHLNRCSVILTGRKMDLKLRLGRDGLLDEEVEIHKLVQKIANLIVMLAELVKLLTSEQYLQDPQLQIAPNYVYSILTLITTLLETYNAQQHFPNQADDLIHGSLWLLETYLHYDSHIRELRKNKIVEKKRTKRQVKKLEIKESKRRIKRFITEQSEEINNDSLNQDEKLDEMEPCNEEPEQITNSKKRRRKRNRKNKNKAKSNAKEEPKTLNKSGSKSNLFEHSQVRTQTKNNQKPLKKQKKADENNLQKAIRDYLHFITSFLGNRKQPLIKNDTLSYLLHFISRHMHRSIIQAPPYLTFEIVLSDLTPHLLRIKVRDARIPGYHFSLCKLGLQLFDDNHIKVDYQLAIKRYMFEHAEQEIPLAQFIKYLRENFKEVTQSNSSIVEIVVVENETKTVRVPFQKAKYEELLADKSKKCLVQLKEGSQLHLLSTRPDPTTSRRKSSSGNQQHKQIKVSDYCPEGELLAFIEQLITHSIRLLFEELDRCIIPLPEGKQEYQTAMEPFTIRSVIQTLQYLVRESPSLGPFIAKFKCRKILLAEMNSQELKHKEQIAAFTMRGLTGHGQSPESLPQIGFLSVLIRLFSPLVVNAISGLVFELCLDSTPLVQLAQGKGEGKAASKGGHVPFASVIRLKVTEQLQNIMFEPIQLEWLYRKLCLLNLVTVLINIREMARLFLENSFTSKLYKQFQAIKTDLGVAWQAQSSQPLPGNYITRIITPFYLAPLSLLQQLNISFHYNKKLNKNAQKVSINTVLNRDSINAQLIPVDALKKYKFKLDWPFHLKREGNVLQVDPQEQEEYYAEADASSESQELSEDEQSLDSENSSFMRYEDLDMPMDESGLESYMSMDEPHEQLLNEQWEYSDELPQREEMSEFPSGEDPILEIDDEEIDLEQPEQPEEGEEAEEAEEDQQAEREDDEDREIEEYLQEEGISPSQHDEINGESLIDQLNGLPSSVSSASFPLHSTQPYREFTLNTVNEEDYFISVNALLNFQKVQSIPRISKAEKRQVHLLRFLLQMTIFPARQKYNETHPRTMTVHETKEEAQVQQNIALTIAFIKDEHIRLAEVVEYNQVYRYDHFHKETPKLSEEVERQFTDHIQSGRRQIPGRRGGFIARDNLIQIMPGWNITEVVHEPPSQQSESLPIDQDPELAIRSEQSHINIDSQEVDESPLEEERDESPLNFLNMQHQGITLENLLQQSNVAMTPQQFVRLDSETQQDILLNIAQHHRNLHNQRNQLNAVQQQPEITPRNSPVSFVQPADQDAVDIPMLQIQSREEDPLSQGRVIEPLSENISPSEQPEGPEPELQEMMAEGEGAANENEVIGEQGQGQPVDEVYRKMSLEHSKKISKDVIEALNKDGKNNSKFHQISFSELEHLLQIFFLTSDTEHSKYPYPLVETLCINTLSLRRIASALLALLHLTPPRFAAKAGKPLIRLPPCSSDAEQQIDYTVRAYPSLALKALHLLTHLTKNYSIAMALLKPNHDLSPTLIPLARTEQSTLSSFQMLILLLREKAVGESPSILGFLIGVLDNITMHHFYKNVHKIVQRASEDDQRVRISEDSVYLLGELLQSDFVSENLPLVSKIIMRLSVQEHNLRNFISYLEHLVRQLTDQALAEVKAATEVEVDGYPNNKATQNDAQMQFKIVNLMSIFYEMVKAFETYPTSLDRHDEVMLSLRRIVQYEKLQQLCERAVRGVFQADSKQAKIGELIDCFFVLNEIAMITSKRAPKTQEEDEHNHIAELGELDLAEQRRAMIGEEQDLWLGKFNISLLWREAVAHPNFKHYVNSNIKRKMSEGAARRASAFELPIIKIAAATPHLLSFDNKYALFKNELKRLRGRAKYQPIHISLRREDVFEASFEHLMTRSGQKLRGKLKIQFQDEQGEDAGGITREWFQLLSREMFNPNYGLFKSGSAGHTYHPSPTSYFNDRHLDYFKFIGRIAGKALYDGYLLDAYFTPAFYKHILALPITYRDMEQQDYEYFKSLTWMLENSPIEDYLELTFTYDCDNFGEIQTKELVPNGANIPVTEENKLQYVQLIAYAKMATSIKMQLEAFLTGLHQLVPHRLLRIFSEKELEIMISGRPTIDIEDLRRNTELVNYMRNDPIIVWLFQVLESFDMQLRTAFIQFVTGSSRVPVEGFKDLRGMNGVQRFNIHREFQEERLPRAHTCFNQLDLPNYKSKEILIEKLMYAITEGKEGFGMI